MFQAAAVEIKKEVVFGHPCIFGWPGHNLPRRHYPTFPPALKKDPPERAISLVSNTFDIIHTQYLHRPLKCNSALFPVA